MSKKQIWQLSGPSTRSCFCVGPQDGQPLCPCRMRDVKIKNGRYVLPERDLGPVRDHDQDEWVQRLLTK